MEEYTLKPNRTAYFTLPFTAHAIALFIIFMIIAFVGHIVWSPLAYVILAGLFFGLEGISFYAKKVAYEKLTFTFTENKIFAKGGGIFSDFESELAVRNITHVRKKLPLIQHRLCGTGEVVIESAGSGDSEIIMTAIDLPDEIFNYVKNLMQTNGFSMAASQLKMERSPSLLAVLLQTGAGHIAPLLGFLVFGLPIILEVADGFSDSADKLGDLLPVVKVAVGFVGVAILAGVLASLYINFSDQKRRIYRIFDDMITYYEGFLTKVEAVLPMENLSDTSLNQNFLDKILNLADVTVSCQGSDQEVHFKNIKDGRSLSEAIDEASSAFKSLVGTEHKEDKTSDTTAQNEQQETSGGKQNRVQKQARQQYTRKPAETSPVTRDTEFTAEYRIDVSRAIIPLIPICVIFPPFLIALIVAYVMTKARKFLVKPESIAMEFSLFSTNTLEFSADKVTGVVMSQNILDRFFNTCTLTFWSIGSGQNVKFSKVKRELIDFEKILAKVGIHPTQSAYTINPSFKLHDHFKRYLLRYIFSAVIFIAVTVPVVIMLMGVNFKVMEPIVDSLGKVLTVVILIIILLGILSALIRSIIVIFFDKKKADFSLVSFQGDHVYGREGFLTKSYYYALYDNVKDITTNCYPFSQNGDLTFNVAGEVVVQNQNGSEGAVVSSSFTVPYVQELSWKDEFIDLILYTRPNAEQVQEYAQKEITPTLLLEAKPAVANRLVLLIIASVIIFPLILLLPLTVPLLLYVVRRTHYRIEDYRVLEQRRTIARKQTSVIFSKIDHINTSRGIFNNMFGNGNITVNTTGSSTPELTIRNIPNYQEFYDELNKHY